LPVQLIHHGIIIAPKPPVHGLVLTIRGEPVALTARQEEMALAWARKQGTPYVRDRVFARNFMTDFSAALSLSRRLSVDAVDFGPANSIIMAERETRASLTKEERKAAAAVRKIKREELKERYGYAIANGERIELGNYMTEPSGIFMGRGKHPLRGRWKEGAAHPDVTLNMSPDSPRPEGDWAEIVWQPDSLWVARWKDKLSGKLKYVWVSDTAPIKQAREALKFDKAIELGASLEAVRTQIQHDLSDPSDKQKMIATACYLIDALCLRVGDEKDPDEADTVGATTLRPEHITLHPDHTVEFRFLGKDSVLWHQRIELPPMVHENLAYLVANACPSNSNTGLSAKVFRTHHATEVVRDSLAECGVMADDPEYGKREAMVLANLDAAILCNHTKQAPAKWATRRVRMREQRLRAKARVDKVREQVREYRARREALGSEAKEKIAAASDKQRPKVRDRYRKRRAVADRRIEAAKGRLQRARVALGKVESRNKLAGKGRTWNLGTSLKSYIDPRVCYRWGQQVDYDVIEKYYPKALQRKFAWVAAGTVRIR